MDFNYTQFHLFDKRGNELPLAYSTTCKVVIPNSNPAGDDAVFFAVINREDIKYDEDGKTIESVNAAYHKITGGSRFTKVPDTGYVEINGAKFKTAVSVNTKSYKTSSSYSSETESLSIDSVNFVDLSSVYEFIETPTVTFTGGVSFDRVSTNLVETESLYMLVKDENGDFIKASDSSSAKTWFDRYKILFFIDTRNDEDFRFFHVTDSDEIEWTNKIVVDCTNVGSKDESSYRVNIGFTSTEEGVHEGVITVCVIDTETTMDDGYNRIYPIGTINLQAEAVGEDERYRTLFANFGIPDPLTYYDSFCNIDPDEGYTDNIILNQNSKRMFLAYPDIFPYLGTYKALINAVNALGYQDLFFKEWYSNTGAETSQGKYTIYDVEYGQPTSNLNIINNLTTSERVKLKKLNWLSMMYKINEVIEESSDSSDSRDVYKSSGETSSIGDHAFPTVARVNSYNNSDLLVKLTSLRSWLEKSIIGLNCRIVDITGEGIYFERYRLDSYGSYQTILEWNNEKNIAPYVTNMHDDNVLIDSSAYICVNLGVDEGATTFEDIKNYRYIDFCEGYIDADSAYHTIRTSTSDDDGSIFVGGSLEYLRGSDMFELKASSVTDSFMFNKGFIKSDDGDTHVSSNLRVTGNEIFFNPYDLYKGYPKTTVFTKLPIIQLERANLRSSGNWGTSVLYSIYPDIKDDTTESYVIENTKTHERQTTIDYVTLVPPVFEESAEEITITTYVSTTASDGKKTVVPVKTVFNKIIDPGIVSDFETPVKKVMRLNYMYGLKYSSDNVYGMPMFSILGYQADHIDSNIPADREMYLEILDGKMLFLDQENNREIYLNFNFDDGTGEQSVTVNIIYHSDEFWVSQYTDDNGENYFKHFIEGNTYEKFTEAYNADPGNVVSHEFIHKIKVNNAGKFLVDVFERDMHNNIFAANCDNYGNIIMPHFDLLEYSNVEGGGLVTDIQALEDNFIDFCIYSPTVMANGISVKTDNGLSIEYPTYSYGLHNVVRGDYVHATDITDMYRVDAIDDIQNTLSGSKGTTANFESFNLVLSPAMAKRYERVLDSRDMYGAAMIYNSIIPKYSAAAEYNEDESGNKVMVSGRLTDYLKLYADGDENFADVNVIFYNELNSHPVYQTYGTLSSDQIFSGDSPYNGKYRLVVQDYSGTAYVWADLLLCTKSALILQLTDVMNEMFSGIDSVRQAEYYLSEYVFKTIKDSSTVEEISAGEITDLKDVNALKDFINDSSVYSVYTSDDCPTDKDARIDFHMPGGNMTNILYDLEAFLVEDDDELEAKTSSKLYDDYIKKDDTEEFEGTAKFENLLNTIINSGEPGSRLYDYMSSLSYEECSEYLKICTSTACKASRECIIGKKTSSDILRTVCEQYAEEFVTDNETAKIYETSVDILTDGGTVSKNVISKICNEIEFDDLKNAGSLAEAFASAIRPFGERIETDGLSYYISCLYGVMVYISTMVLQYIIGEAEKYSCKYGEVNSELSKHVYNRFCPVFNFIEKTDDEGTGVYDSSTSEEDGDVNEIRSAAISILAAFTNTIYTGYTKELGTEGTSQLGISIKSALCNKIFDNSITEQTQISIYNKLINNAAWQSYTEMSDAGWVFMNTLEYNDEIDDMTEENSRSRCKFAVISGDDFRESESLKKHYVKTAEYGDDGYSEVTNDVPITASVSIMDIVKRPYISTYIKPIWKSSVNAYILDSSTVENLGLDLNYDYLCVGYKKSLFSNRFKRGEKVKLIFQPAGQTEYFGQSTYEVVGYDVVNNYMILKGSINRAYINNDAEELWGYLPVENGYAYIPSAERVVSETFRDVTGTTEENGNIVETRNEIMTKIQVTEATKYITVSYTMSGNTLLLTVPVKYVKDDSEAGGYWLYKLYGYNNISAPSAVTINASKIEKMNIYISYAHHGFVDYPMKSAGFNENGDGVTEIEIENTNKNRKFMDFIDDTFSISGRSFDIDEGVYNWMSGMKKDNTLNGGTPDIMKSLTSMVYLRKNEFTEMYLSDANIVIASDSDGMIDEGTSYKYWKVYYNNGDGNSVLLFESYNPELYLAPKERGIYDIEATIYDRYGNESTHMYKGAYIVK